MKCKTCKINESVKYSKHTNGKFCSKKCAISYSTKEKRKEINEKVRKKLTGSGNSNVEIICGNCNNSFTVEYKRRNQKTCSRSCASKLRWCDDEYRDNITELIKKKCSTIEERKRLRNIGRKGGFGKRGITNGGTKYESLFEKEFFELLEDNEINFEAHKNIPNSSKVSDLYLTEIDTWIEIDGIDREKRKKWLGKNYDYWISKLKIYETQKLNLKIFKEFSNFEKFIKNKYGEVA